jgi:hypothetical protein
MNVRHEITTLSDGSGTAIPSNRQDPVQYSVSFTVQNIDGSANVYIGDSSVSTSSYGVKLVPGAIASFENVARGSGFYAITDSNGSQVAILQTSF